MTDAADRAPDNRDADEVERHPCPRCRAQPGSPCRSRSGAVAGAYHTGRFAKVPRLSKALRVPTPADRGPGQPWRSGAPPPAPPATGTATAEIRIGYARCSTLTQELQSQLDSLAAHGVPRDKVFSEKISTRVRVRPRFEAALALARQIKAHAPHCRVILTVYEMKRLGRDAAELTALADHLTAHGLVLEMLAGPLPGIYDPSGPGWILFAFFAAMAETERENIREATLEGLTAAARKGNHGGRPAGHHRRHAAHRSPAPRERRVSRTDPTGPDHPHRQTQGPAPEPGQHLPGACRARQERRRTPRPSTKPTSSTSGRPATADPVRPAWASPPMTPSAATCRPSPGPQRSSPSDPRRCRCGNVSPWVAGLRRLDQSS